MCQSYRKTCVCGKNTAEIFFGKNVLEETAVARVFCPECSPETDIASQSRVWDNGWVLELDMECVRERAPVMGSSPDAVCAEWVFDEGFATWVGITPDDAQTRNRERDQFQSLAKSDVRAYIKAMRDWGIERERRFIREGWRKMKPHARLALLMPPPHSFRR